MAHFDLNKYDTVESRLEKFWDQCPEGRIITYMLSDADHLDEVVVKAEIYADREDARPVATGMAFERRGGPGANSTSHLENCETSAIGRAFANWIFKAKKDSPRPSQSEMRKSAHTGNGNGTQVQRNSAPAQYRHETVDGRYVHPKTVDPATQRETTILRGEENQHYAPRTTDEEATVAAALKRGIANHKGWMVSRKLDPENKALSLWLLNHAYLMVDPECAEVEDGWVSRKHLTPQNWTDCNAYLAKLKPSELQKIVQEFYASIEAEEAGAVEPDPFADEAPTALMDVPVTAPAGRGHGDS